MTEILTITEARAKFGTLVRRAAHGVVRPARERHSPVTGSRAIGKLVSDAYLTRKGGTEYE